METAHDPTRPVRRPIVGNESVLIVEDDADTQMFMKSALRGYRVFVAASGEEARAALAAHGAEIGAIFLDLSLHGPEDGLMLTRYIRQSPRLRHILVIATSAHASREDRDRCLAVGSDDYLPKPVAPTELVRVLEAHRAGRK